MIPISSQHPAQATQIAASAQQSRTTPGKFNIFHRGKRITHALRKSASGGATKLLTQFAPRQQPVTSGPPPGAKPAWGARAAAAIQPHASKSRSSQSHNAHGGNALPHEDYVPRENAHERERQQKNQQQHEHRDDEEERQRDGLDPQDNEDDDIRRRRKGFERSAGLRALRADRDVSAGHGVLSSVASMGSEPHEAATRLLGSFAQVLIDTLHRPASAQVSITAALFDVQSAFPRGIAIPNVNQPFVAIKAALIDAHAGRAATAGVPTDSSVDLQLRQRLFVLAPLLLQIAGRPATRSALAGAASRRATLRNHVTATHTRVHDESSGIPSEVRIPTAQTPRKL